MATVSKDVETVLARMCGQSSVMDKVAARVAAKARAIAAAHENPRTSTSFAASISVERAKAGKQGVVDRVVVASHPAVLSVEFGHRASNGRWVDGIHALTRALK